MLLIFVIFKPETMATEERIYGIEKTDKRPTYVTGRDFSITPFSWSYIGICSHSNGIVSVRYIPLRPTIQ